MRRAAQVAVVSTVGLLALPHHSIAVQGHALDGFEDLAAWQAAPSDGVSLEIEPDEGFRGRAMRLEFDFHAGGGYAVARRPLALELPDNYALTFWIRGVALPNNLEIKLVDPSGENVWWVNRRDFVFPGEWTLVTLKKRHIAFAWGPIGGGEIRQVGAIEFAVTAGSGGSGSVWIDELAIEARPTVEPYGGTPIASASSTEAGTEAARVVDGDSSSAWRSDASGRQWLALDFQALREYGGLVIDWEPGAHASDYAVETSDDGIRWEIARRVTAGDGGRDWLYLPESESRALRLALESGPARRYGVRELGIRPLEFSTSMNDFFRAIAAESPRGVYPRPFLDELVYWTVVGGSGDEAEALLAEDGRLEIHPGGFSIEPFVSVGDRLLTWADGEHRQTLLERSLPIPTVTRAHGDLVLAVTAVAAGDSGASVLHVRYRVHNKSETAARAGLFLAIRPFQVNPPTQFLAVPGGVARVREISRTGNGVLVDGHALLVRPEPVAFGAATFDQGDVVERLLRGSPPSAERVDDPFEHASAMLTWELEIAPGDSAEVDLVAPFHPPSIAPGPGKASDFPSFDVALAETAARWRERLGRVSIELPGEAARLVDVLRSNVAFILINRDGPAIQPGSRAYDRSWIRDGALTSAALLRMGHAGVVRDFIEWYSGFQYPSGKIPCCVDHRGADPVPEHDSHGEFVYLVAEYTRFTGDTVLARAMWPHVAGAVGYVDSIRQTRLGPEYQVGEKRLFRGILPESISHEGYSARPVHSYWDDFFALRGLEDAVELAETLGETEEAARFAAIRDAFRTDFHASIRAAIQHHGIDYVPGSADLGDFDATSTTIGVAPGGQLERLPRRELLRTFERYLAEHERRLQEAGWEAYTPYELRVVGTLVRLGWKEQAHELLPFFFGHLRPTAWNAWAEVVGREARSPRFIGDLPHTWVGSDYIRSLLDLFVYDRERDQALVVGAGIPADWARADGGVRARGLLTRWGRLDFEIAAAGDSARVRLEGDLEIPPGGLVVLSPLEAPVTGARIYGRPLQVGDSGEVIVRSLPAAIVFLHRRQ
ncbi:MAG TPA: discoidin domain-containing protein [Gemmatimonadota bacterium]|nr:discoidin domain-containing protein [Gemmatimonadota bacterium]